METTVEILNKIANKLGDENADQYTTVAQALGQIANALGNADPDKIQTVPEALEEILAVAGGGGGAGGSAKITFDITPPEGVDIGWVTIKRFSNVINPPDDDMQILGSASAPISKFVVPVLTEGFVASMSDDNIIFEDDNNAYIFSAEPQIEGNVSLEDGLLIITGDCKITGTVVLRS